MSIINIENEKEKLTQDIENRVTLLYRASEEGKLTLEDRNLIYESIQRSEKMLAKLTEKFEKIIKKDLEFVENATIGNRKFSYKVQESTVFDANKAKKTLEELNYQLTDFNKIQVRKTLIWEAI